MKEPFCTFTRQSINRQEIGCDSIIPKISNIAAPLEYTYLFRMGKLRNYAMPGKVT